MTKYLIFGNGFLGNKFLNYLPDSTIAEGRINTINDVYMQIDKYNPDIIINCIGKTGIPNVDWCEYHREETFFSNVTIPAFIAEACQERKKYMVHLGSGCIYQGDNNGSGFDEYNSPNFFGSYYSKTKIFAEDILSEYVRSASILTIRIRMPIDCKPHNRNLIDKLVGYRQVIGDVKNSVTCIPDLLRIGKELMDRRVIGTINIVNDGVITHKQILTMYKNIVDTSYELPEFITIEEFERSRLVMAERSNCVLVNERLKELGIEIREVHEAVRDCLEKYNKDKME